MLCKDRRSYAPWRRPALEKRVRARTFHMLAGEIGDSVDGHAPVDDGGLVREGMETATFYGGESLRGEMIVQ